MAKNTNVLMIVAIILIGVLAIGLITGLIIFKGNGGGKCVPEHGNIVYGSGGIKSGECCEGLVEKSPEDWTGSSWCMRPECDIECNYEGTESEGYYDSCYSGIACIPENPCMDDLIKYIKCSQDPHYLSEGEYCGVSAEGVCYKGLECASPCFCENGRLTCATTLICMNPSDVITSCSQEFSCKTYFENHPETEGGNCYFLYDPVCSNNGITYSNDCVACMSGAKTYTKGEC